MEQKIRNPDKAQLERQWGEFEASARDLSVAYLDFLYSEETARSAKLREASARFAAAFYEYDRMHAIENGETYGSTLTH